MENSSTDAKKVIGALLIGTAVGAAIGILFAPAKGKDTRKAIADQGEDFADTMKEKFNEFMDTVKKEYEAVKEKAGNLTSDGKLYADGKLSAEGKARAGEEAKMK